MRKSPTLPSIKEKQQSSLLGLQNKDNFRKIQHRVNFHDEEIVKNQKIISSLANEFRLLKEQLQFEQQYSEKYQASLLKYEEDSKSQQRIIKDQKALIARLEQTLRDRERHFQTLSRDHRQQHAKLQQFDAEIQQLKKNLRKKEQQLRAQEGEREKLSKKLKEREKQYSQLRDSSGSEQAGREQLIQKLSKEIESVKAELERGKEEVRVKQEQIDKLLTHQRQLDKAQQQLNKRQQQFAILKQQHEQLRITFDQFLRAHPNCESKLQQKSATIREGQEKITSLQDQIALLQAERDSDKKALKKSLSACEDLKKSLELEGNLKSSANREIQELKARILVLQKRLSVMEESKAKIRENLAKIQKSTGCEYCKKALRSPVTNIPCGHSFCLQCKKGYEKQCVRCPGLKREAVYRNELLDDIVEAARLIEKVLAQLSPS